MSDPVPTEPTDTAIRLRLRSLRDTARLGRALARVLSAAPPELLLLEGQLGAGKTCLVRFIVRALGVPAEQPVTSPTFEILHEFHGAGPVLHADLYRLDPSEPLEELGLLDRIGEAVVLIEWGERFAAQLGDSGLRATLALEPGGERSCTIAARGAAGQPLLERLIPLLSAAGLPPF